MLPLLLLLLLLTLFTVVSVPFVWLGNYSVFVLLIFSPCLSNTTLRVSRSSSTSSRVIAHKTRSSANIIARRGSFFMFSVGTSIIITSIWPVLRTGYGREGPFLSGWVFWRLLSRRLSPPLFLHPLCSSSRLSLNVGRYPLYQCQAGPNSTTATLKGLNWTNVPSNTTCVPLTFHRSVVQFRKELQCTLS